jgi:hypothetical protein
MESRATELARFFVVAAKHDVESCRFDGLIQPKASNTPCVDCAMMPQQTINRQSTDNRGGTTFM